MYQSKRGYLAVFGNIKLKKLFCKECQQFAFIVKRLYTCCGKREDFEPDTWKRECDADSRKNRPPMWKRREVLRQQQNRCLYCECMFGSSVRRREKVVRLTICWDHFSPYSYSRDNGPDNFVAACQICNGIKSNKIFDTLESAQVYIQTQRRNNEERTDQPTTG